VKRCAAVGIVCGPEFSSMRGNDGTAHRKAQPHAFLFCGEERLENLFHFFLRNAAASVDDGNNHCAVAVLDSSANEQSAIASQALTTKLSKTC